MHQSHYVWPSTLVEESNLRFQMMSLRKALGKDRDIIKTIPGRGYLFAGEFLAAGDGPDVSSETRVPTCSSTTRSSIEISPAPHDTARPSVAIIDDDPTIREALQGLLLSVGFEVEAFDSPRAFLDSPRRTPPGCLVLDMWLPGQSGLEFQAELAKANIPSPVIFISGHVDVPTCVRAMKAGAIEFLTKPVRHQELLDALQLAIAADSVGFPT